MSISLGVYLQAQQDPYYLDFTELRNSSSVYGNNYNLGSSRYMGMAGAMGAIGGDVSAGSVNPAGIGVFITGNVEGTLNINSYKNTSNLNGRSSLEKDNRVDLSQVGGVVAIPLSGTKWQFVNVGVNYVNESLDNQVLSPENYNISAPVDWVDDDGNTIYDELLFDGHRYERYGNRSKMGISVGGNYDNKIYIGAGLNFHSTNFDQYDYYQGTYESDGFSEIYDKQFSPYSEIGNGFSASVGIIGKIHEQFRLGAAIETPTWWNIERSYTQYTPVSDADPTIANIDNYREDRNFRTPMKATLSAAFIPNKNFAIDVDYTLGLTKPKFTTQTEINDDLNNYFDNHSTSESEVRVGAEYRIEGFRVRAGYAFASNPFDSQTMTVFQNDGSISNSTFDNLYVGKRNTLGVGVGYDFKSFYIDAAYQNLNYKYDNAFAGGDYATYDNNGNGIIVNNEAPIVSEVKNQRNNILFTIGFRF